MELLDAATEEFAAHGLAGADLARIGAAAGIDTATVGDRAALFDRAVEHSLARIGSAVRFDPTDLPRYAGELFEACSTTRSHSGCSCGVRWNARDRVSARAARTRCSSTSSTTRTAAG